MFQNIKTKWGAVRARANALLVNRAGEANTGLVITILIVVIVGGILLGILSNALPELWNNIMNKISETFQ